MIEMEKDREAEVDIRPGQKVEEKKAGVNNARCTGISRRLSQCGYYGRS